MLKKGLTPKGTAEIKELIYLVKYVTGNAVKNNRHYPNVDSPDLDMLNKILSLINKIQLQFRKEAQKHFNQSINLNSHNAKLLEGANRYCATVKSCMLLHLVAKQATKNARMSAIFYGLVQAGASINSKAEAIYYRPGSKHSLFSFSPLSLLLSPQSNMSALLLLRKLRLNGYLSEVKYKECISIIKRKMGLDKDKYKQLARFSELFTYEQIANRYRSEAETIYGEQHIRAFKAFLSQERHYIAQRALLFRANTQEQSVLYPLSKESIENICSYLNGNAGFHDSSTIKLGSNKTKLQRNKL